MGQQVAGIKAGLQPTLRALKGVEGYVAVDTDGGEAYWNATEHAGFLDGMASEDMPRDGFEYLSLWDSNEVGMHLRSVLLSPNDAFNAVTWFCAHVHDVREDSSAPWSRVWRALCDEYRVAVIGLGQTAANDPLLLQRTDFLERTIRKCFTCEFMHLARVMPSYLGYPLIQALQDTAKSLRFDVVEHLLNKPSEGIFLFWYGTLWHHRGAVFQSKIQKPSIDVVISELVCVRTGESKVLKKQKNVGEFKGPATASQEFERNPVRERVLTQMVKSDEKGDTDLAAVMEIVGEDLFEEPAEDQEEEEEKHTSESCISVLEALCHAFKLMKPKEAQLSRLQLILSIAMSGHMQGTWVRIMTSHQLYFAFQHEDEALTFLLYAMRKMDEQQMLAHFEELQEQFQQFIRLHPNPLFTALRLTAAICSLSQRSGTMQEQWGEEFKRLKKIAVQIFEMLPEESFHRLFESSEMQQKFTQLVVVESECVEMLSVPRFQEYLNSRWSGRFPSASEVHEMEDYTSYWESLLDPNTLIYSPKMRFAFRGISFVLFTFMLHILPEDFIRKCDSPDNLGYAAIIQAAAIGHIVHEVVDIVREGLEYFYDFWDLLDAALAVLYALILMHCNPYLSHLDEEVLWLVWGLMLGVMVLRWLQFLTCFPKFGALVKTIGLMGIDISSFLVVFTIFLLAWALCFSRLRRDDPDYATTIASVFTFFRASLGDFDLMTILHDHDEKVYGYFESLAIVAFLLVSAVLLLNLLISIMSATFETVRERGDGESAKTFLATIDEGENHELWELGALPPPFNILYILILPFYFAAAYLAISSIEPINREKRMQKFKYFKKHVAAQTLMRLVLLPVTLFVLAVTTVPSFVILIVLSWSVPFEPKVLDVFNDFSTAWCTLKCHLLMPSIRLRLLYERFGKPRCIHRNTCVDILLIPWLSLGCFITAIIIIVAVMPCHWVYEALIRGLAHSAEETSQQLLSEDGEDNKDAPDEAAEEDINFVSDALQEYTLGLMNQGRMVLSAGDEEFDLLMSDAEIDPMVRKEKKFNVVLKPEQRSEIQAFFMRDMHTLDLGMLWCFSNKRRSPPLLAAQLEQTFANSYGHDGRIEYMLKKLMSQTDHAGNMNLWDPIARLGNKAAKLDLQKLNLKRVGAKLDKKLHVKQMLGRIRGTKSKK